ncbi:hypothetical protein SAMN05660657_01742 [Geodermatophilus amargosae]|uniref:Uncharacterized protein n=1 Tax=Geodermatophilus amargosae TaxID=1296565 RepID=A0A1I6Z6L3_9ACTN|nr:hypothetical protein SAMN05660657_01742 [Geodermatophilus amargosae]
MLHGWAAVLLLAAVFLGHGLQCSPAAGHPTNADHGQGSPTVSVALTATDTHRTDPTAHAAESPAMAAPAAHTAATPATTADSTPGHWHGLPGHLWMVCLAVLAAGLAVLAAVLAPRLVGLASPLTAPRELRGARWPTPLRPPELSSLCVLRI